MEGASPREELEFWFHLTSLLARSAFEFLGGQLSGWSQGAWVSLSPLLWLSACISSGLSTRIGAHCLDVYILVG